MKKLALSFMASLMALSGMAQGPASQGMPGEKGGQISGYQAFIYTSDDLSDEIQRESARSRGSAIFDAGVAAAQGLAGGYVTSFLDLGVNAIASLVTKNSRQKAEWEETVAQENKWNTTIETLSEVNDFYDETSFDGAMDPKGMRFDGIGCLRREGNDTVFYVSCHIDRSKINRIIDHSKFELVLDTLIISPTRSNLPNSKLDIPFSFDERRNFNFSMKIKLSSSWMNEVVQLQKDQVLGEFTINVPVTQKALDDRGYLRYVRNEGETSAYDVVGESFIVPRSYMGYRDPSGQYRNSWGTGEYKLSIELSESCDVTEQYRKNWKEDRKRRKKMEPKKDFMDSAWQVMKSQKWDEMSQTWIITILKGPVGVITTEVNDKLGFSMTTQSGAGTSAQTAKSGQGTATPAAGGAGQSQGGPQQGGRP